MKAVVCHQSELTVRDVADPRPEKGQLLLQVVRCGICGSDLHARHHAEELKAAAHATGYDGVMGPDDAVVMGHEFVGEVTDVAAGSRGGFRTGDRVVALPIVRASGGVHPTGLSAFAPGAYAEQVVVESSLAMKVPDGLPTDVAALTEPMAVALHAVRRGEVGRKQVAIVVGCGPIGLAVIAMLKATGVRTVVASDFSAGRRVMAQAIGPDIVVDPATEDPWTAYDTSRYITEAFDEDERAASRAGGRERLAPVHPFGRPADQRRHAGRQGRGARPDRIGRTREPGGTQEAGLRGRVDLQVLQQALGKPARRPAQVRLDLADTMSSEQLTRSGELLLRQVERAPAPSYDVPESARSKEGSEPAWRCGKRRVGGVGCTRLSRRAVTVGGTAAPAIAG